MSEKEASKVWCPQTKERLAKDDKRNNCVSLMCGTWVFDFIPKENCNCNNFRKQGEDNRMVHKYDERTCPKCWRDGVMMGHCGLINLK
jgi:hypothetical protein